VLTALASSAAADHTASNATFREIDRYLTPSARTLDDHLRSVEVSSKGPYALAHEVGGQGYYLVLKRKRSGWRAVVTISDQGLRCGLVPKPVISDLHLERYNIGPKPCGRVSLSNSAAAALVLALVAVPSATTVPTELGHPQARPYRIGYTGDGSAFLGGFTRYRALHKSSRLSDFGRLRWTTYNAAQGRAVGADWIDNFVPDGAAGTFHPVRATVHVYRPRRGIFTRMTISDQGHAFTLDANGPEGWQ
jgi:hypothetical protein